MRIYFDMNMSKPSLYDVFVDGIAGKKIRFLGVGGVGVNALAKFCIDEGAIVSGSDRVKGDLAKQRETLGAKIDEGDSPEQIDGVDAVVFSSAIRDDNQELERARELGITTFERHEFLRLVANCFDKVVGIAGSHGKTTVTAMLTHVLLKADENFVSMIGGEAIEFSNFVNNMGDGDGIFVTEACEYRRHMLALDVDVAVVLNTDWDHPDSYPTRESIEKAFAEFLRKAKVKVFESGVRSVTVRADETTTFEYETLGDYANVFEDGKFVGSLTAKGQGEYNLKNSLFAIAVAHYLKVPAKDSVKALNSFKGVRRRFEKAGEINGVPVIFDFAHHPTEIKNLLARAKAFGSLLVVFQPHTYSRTKAYMDEFADVFSDAGNGVKTLIICPTYAAREQYDTSATSDILANAILSKNVEKRVYTSSSAKSTLEFVNMMSKCHDVVLFVGAGDVYDLKRCFEAEN